jgi:hypothetical protein
MCPAHAYAWVHYVVFIDKESEFCIIYKAVCEINEAFNVTPALESMLLLHCIFTVLFCLPHFACRDCPGMKARLGEWDITRNTEPYSYQDYVISSVHIHPEFNSANLQNDIAVIKLSQQIPLGVYPNINPACLSQQNTAFTGER